MQDLLIMLFNANNVAARCIQIPLLLSNRAEIALAVCGSYVHGSDEDLPDRSRIQN